MPMATVQGGKGLGSSRHAGPMRSPGEPSLHTFAPIATNAVF